MDWLNALNTLWAPVIWILSSGVFLLVWYFALRRKHKVDISNAAIKIHRKRFINNEISQKEFERLKESLTK
jgi:uncharacterized membrane protein